MNGHHLILGKLTDFITGEVLEDTHDERYRQKLARLLVEDKGYRRVDIIPRCGLVAVSGDGKRARLTIDFKVRSAGKTGMLIKYGPGSLVTRQRPALAAARLLEPYQIPVVVVSNGRDAEILSGENGKIISRGLEGIPAKTAFERLLVGAAFGRIPAERALLESRILYAFEVDGACPCDDSVCRLE